WLNLSPNGAWLALSTGRFDPACASWACLAIVKGDLSSGQAIRARGQLVHPDAFGAVASSGNLVVYPQGGGPHKQDLWAGRRTGATWQPPGLLTGASPYAYQPQPATSADGSRVVCDCGNQPYEPAGTAICEVGTDGRQFSTVLRQAQGPAGSRRDAALHHPAFAPDGSLVFESDWAGEQI